MQEKLKIITSIDGNVPSRFAHSFNVMKMSDAFSDLGHSVEMVTYNNLISLKNRTKLGNIYKYYGLKNKFKITKLKVLNKNFFKSSVGDRIYNIKASEYINRQKPDFVFARSYLTPYYCIEKGLPTIIEAHTTNYYNKDLRTLFTLASNPNFLGLVTIHKQLKKEYSKLGVPEEKIVVLEDGVDLEQFNLSDRKDEWRQSLDLPLNKTIVTYIGSLYKEKGIDQIIATAKILRKHEDILFLIIGAKSKTELDEWEKTVKKSNLNNILFKEFIPNYLVPKFLKASDILLMPYNLRVDYKIMDIGTTSPLKMFEYMASMRPIISTKIEAVSKVLKHNKNALLAEPNNISQIAEFIIDLKNDAKKRARLSKQAYKKVEEFEWQSRCKTIIEKLYEPSKK